MRLLISMLLVLGVAACERGPREIGKRNLTG
jgi:hypothetical protein